MGAAAEQGTYKFVAALCSELAKRASFWSSGPANFLVRDITSYSRGARVKSNPVLCGGHNFSLVVLPAGTITVRPPTISFTRMSVFVEIDVPADASDDWQSDAFGFCITLLNWEGRKGFTQTESKFVFSKQAQDPGWHNWLRPEDLTSRSWVRPEDKAVKFRFQVWRA